MIGIVIVTHGRLAIEFIAAAEHIVGPLQQIEAICIGPEDDMTCRRNEIAASAARVDSGQGVVLLTDLFGGTPSNLALSLSQQEQREVIAGLNLPLLVQLVKHREETSLSEVVAHASAAGRKYICVASALLGEYQPNSDGDSP